MENQGTIQNEFDNVIVKHIDVLQEDGTINTIVSTEWFAEHAFQGNWHVNTAWLEANTIEQASILVEKKASANEAINQWRLKVNSTSFPFDGRQVACDTLSRSDLDGMANYVNLFGEFPAGFLGKWKCVDNSYISFDDVQDFKDMYAAMVDQGNANFVQAQTLKAKLAQASTLEAVEAINKLLESEYA